MMKIKRVFSGKYQRDQSRWSQNQETQLQIPSRLAQWLGPPRPLLAGQRKGLSAEGYISAVLRSLLAVTHSLNMNTTSFAVACSAASTGGYRGTQRRHGLKAEALCWGGGVPPLHAASCLLGD